MNTNRFNSMKQNCEYETNNKNTINQNEVRKSLNPEI